MSHWPLPIQDPAYLAYLLVFAAAALGCLAGAWRARRVESPGVRRGLIGLLTSSGLWALAYIGMLLAPSLWGKTAFYEAGLIVGFGTVFAWLWLCSAFSGRSLHQSRAVRWVAVAVFALVTLSKLTNPWHGLYFSAGWEGVPFRHLAVDHHTVYWITAGLSYMGAAVGFFMLAEPLRRAKVGTGRLVALFGLTALPLGANAIGYAGPWLLDVSHEPIGVAAFALGALFVSWSRFEEVARAGRRERPALVLFGEGRIQNYNRRAAGLFPALNKEEAVGAELGTVLPGLREVLPKRNGSEPEVAEGQVLAIEGGRVPLGGDGQVGAGREIEEGRIRHFRPVETTFRRGAGRLVVLKDVTEQELRRREREARLEAISSSMPGVAFELRAELDGKRSVEFIGAEAETLLGLSSDLEGFYDRFVGRIPSSHRRNLRHSVKEAIRGAGRWRKEFPFDRPDGERIWLLGSAEPEVVGEKTLFRGTFIDITERVEERQRRKQTIRRTTDGIVEVGPDWRCTLVNDQAEKLYGTAREDLLGERLWETFPELKGTRFEEEYRAVMQTREPSSVEEYHSGLDGWFDVQIYPNEDGGLAFYFEETTERKEHEEALRRQEEQLRSITENVSDGIYRSTPEEGITYANSAFIEMFGYESLEELRAADPSGFYADPAEREALYRREVEQGGFDGVEVQFQRKDGSTFFGLLSTKRVEGDDEGPSHYDGAITNITGRRRRKEKLERQNDLFERAQEIADVGAWEYDVRAEEGTMTEQVYRIYGLSPDLDMTYERTLSLYHPEDRPAIREAFGRAVEEGEPYDLELRVVTDAGEEKWARVRGEPQRGEDGEIIRVRGTIRDITERKGQEHALQERREKIEALYSATGRLLRAEHREEVSTRIHEVLGEVFDYPFAHTGFVDEELIWPEQTETTADLALPEPEPRLTDGDTVVARALQAGEAVVVGDTEALDNPIEYGDLRSAAGVPIGEQGAIVVGRVREGGFDQMSLRLLEVLGSYAALVLGRLEREDELLSAKEEAEAANRLKSAFLATMSHEIRTPLTSILGFAGAIGEEVQGTGGDGSALDLATLQKFAGLIEKSGERLMDTLTGVLNLSQLEAGEMDLAAEPVDLAEQTEQIAREHRSQAEEKGLDLQVCIQGDSPIWAEADEDGVQIVLRNLVSNAVKYTEEGEVWVRVSRAEGKAVIEVEDSGIGMDPSRVEGLFEPFRQASEGWSREYEGTGLGLAVTKEAAEQMDGSVEVETEKGEGSCFTVWLPQAERLSQDQATDERLVDVPEKRRLKTK